MGKGYNKRHRLKLAKGANHGNLLKASFGKASANLPLPQAPKQQDQHEKVPASMRKLLALKEAASKSEPKKPKPQQGRPSFHSRPKEVQAHAAGAEADDGPSTSGRDANAASHASSNSSKGAGKAGDSQPSAQDRWAQQDQQVLQAGIEKAVGKKLKAKKKEFLKRKELRKKHPNAKKEELELIEKAILAKTSKPTAAAKFGEVAKEPLKVLQKSKHWVEKKESERCKEVFLKQMREAQQRAGISAASAPIVGGMLVQDPFLAARAGPQGKKRKVELKEDEREQVREQVIQAYRSKKQNVNAGSATLTSLAALVKKSSSAPAHTLE